MSHPTNEKADPCKDRPESTTNDREHTTPTALGATPQQRIWRPVTIGEVIERKMADVETAVHRE